MDNLNNNIENQDRKILQDKRIIFVLIILLVAFRLIYTTVGIQHEQATGEKHFQVIPYDAALYSLYLISKEDGTGNEQNNSTAQPENRK